MIDLQNSFLKSSLGVSCLSPQAKALAAKPKNLSSILETHTLKGQN